MAVPVGLGARHALDLLTGNPRRKHEGKRQYLRRFPDSPVVVLIIFYFEEKDISGDFRFRQGCVVSRDPEYGRRMCATTVLLYAAPSCLTSAGVASHGWGLTCSGGTQLVIIEL